jgi:Zn-finger nucleic acid-binding protein
VRPLVEIVETLRCKACEKEVDLTGMFPGARVVCVCGAETVVPGHTPGSSPGPYAGAAAGKSVAYRTAEAPPVEAAMMKCPFCGGPCASDVRTCPHCNVELASVRCPHCFTLHFTGSRFCARCGKELELEPLLDATDAPCPRCDKPLSIFGGTLPDELEKTLPLHECTGCGGVFVSQKTLDAIVARESPGPKPPTHDRVSVPAVRHADTVRYVKCPLCHVLMNRVNFGKRSGVIVDVCKAHGVWFDKGELTDAIEFVARGGLEEAKRRDAEDAGLKKEAAKLHVELMEEAVRDGRAAGLSLGRREGWWQTEHHATLLDIFLELLR